MRYGANAALDGVSFTVPRGEVSMVVGGDGAGKTTLLRSLIGGVRTASGAIAAPPQRECAFMPTGAAGVWQDLTVDENIEFVGAAYGLRGEALRDRRDTLLAAAGLDTVGARLAGALSGGMRQKLSFCLAMLHRPLLLVLDEPSTGVDPVSRIDLWRLISQAAVDGAAVAMATTYLDEAERASTVLVLDSGRALASGTPEQVIADTPGTITTGDAPAGDPALSWRRGRSTHSWHAGPPAAHESPFVPDMEDCVIATTLADRTPAGADR
ncbi:ABC transporter ATP-binding protein [Nocardia alni]|uniref:ABC transporter ATP-binding protein n=1 Tax=Nocardia alni TaxID=2815723 RepID=UPI0027E0C8E1|nr:ABC transporter ATP-binding protein [Nocardia alni]